MNEASVEVRFPDGRRRRLEHGASVSFGRADGGDVVGLNSLDTGISRVAGEFRLEPSGLVKIFNHSGRTTLSIASARIEGQTLVRPGAYTWIDFDATVLVVGRSLDRYEVRVSFRRYESNALAEVRTRGDTLTEREVLTAIDLGALVALCRPMLMQRGAAATNAEAARWLDIPQKTYETRLDRAVVKLARLWKLDAVPERDALCVELVRRGVVSAADLDA